MDHTKNSGSFSVDQLVKGIIIDKVSHDTFSIVKKAHADSSTAFSRYMGQVLGVFLDATPKSNDSVVIAEVMNFLLSYNSKVSFYCCL